MCVHGGGGDSESGTFFGMIHLRALLDLQVEKLSDGRWDVSLELLGKPGARAVNVGALSVQMGCKALRSDHLESGDRRPGAESWASQSFQLLIQETLFISTKSDSKAQHIKNEKIK